MQLQRTQQIYRTSSTLQQPQRKSTIYFKYDTLSPISETKMEVNEERKDSIWLSTTGTMAGLAAFMGFGISDSSSDDWQLTKVTTKKILRIRNIKIKYTMPRELVTIHVGQCGN